GDSAGAGSAKGGAAVMEHAAAAREEGIDPTSAAATPAFEAILAAFASDGVDVAAPEWRAQVLDDLERFTDTRAERYWQLLAIINGWPAHPPTTPAFEWFASALRARL